MAAGAQGLLINQPLVVWPVVVVLKAALCDHNKPIGLVVVQQGSNQRPAARAPCAREGGRLLQTTDLTWTNCLLSYWSFAWYEAASMPARFSCAASMSQPNLEFMYTIALLTPLSSPANNTCAAAVGNMQTCSASACNRTDCAGAIRVRDC
jgi:hypothetical protein